MVGLYTRQTLKAWHEIIVKPFYARIFQFFGRLQRAWIGVKNLLKYEGVESFEARAENAKLYQGVMKRRLHGAFNPTGNVNLKPLLYHQEFYEPWLLNLEWILGYLVTSLDSNLIYYHGQIMMILTIPPRSLIRSWSQNVKLTEMCKA